jgi:hypothetical protein
VQGIPSVRGARLGRAPADRNHERLRSERWSPSSYEDPPTRPPTPSSVRSRPSLMRRSGPGPVPGTAATASPRRWSDPTRSHPSTRGSPWGRRLRRRGGWCCGVERGPESARTVASPSARRWHRGRPCRSPKTIFDKPWTRSSNRHGRPRLVGPPGPGTSPHSHESWPGWSESHSSWPSASTPPAIPSICAESEPARRRSRVPSVAE